MAKEERAFPLTTPSVGVHNVEPGMTLRDYFAGQALAGLVTHDDEKFGGHDAAENVVKAAYTIADAMLAERAKGGA